MGPEPEQGPSARERFFREQRLARLGPVGTSGAGAGGAPGVLRDAVAGAGSAAGQAAIPVDRRELIRQYRERQQHVRDPAGGTGAGAGGGPGAPPPVPTPATSWIPIGPSVVRQGQGGVRPPTSGRAVGIATTPGGARTYVATANGGVWRSDDGGGRWRSLMESWDLNPETTQSDSLACGAIAVVPGPPDRIYVGSGEGDSSGDFSGVGPIVSHDGGTNWATEEVAAGSPPLAGSAFYALAVDPADRDRVVAGTKQGIYRREPDGSGGFRWACTVPGVRGTSVVVARQGTTTTFFAARRSGPVHSSTDGRSWKVVGTGFPEEEVARIGLALQAGNPNVVYALVANSDGFLKGLFRLDRAHSHPEWRSVTGVPAEIFGDPHDPKRPHGQGNYDLAIAVDPHDVNRIYLGGSTVLSEGDWSGALYRGDVTVTGSTAAMTATYIGGSVHADIHALAFAPGDPQSLWVGCDGGVFFSDSPGGPDTVFRPRNTGLATLTMRHIGQHPTEDAVLFCGSQDNGGHRFTGEEAWLYSSSGDAGHQLVNWNDPYRVLSTYVGNEIRRSNDGGRRGSYDDIDVPLEPEEPVLFYPPLAGTTPNPAAPAEADLIAFGSIRPWISTTFGAGWTSVPSGTLDGDRLDANIQSLTFASGTRLYAGTEAGGVYRFDRAGGTWSRTRIDTVGGATALPIHGPVTDIAVDPADGTGSSVYIAFGGTGDYRRVWHFNGTSWAPRSGPAAGSSASLLNVHANAVAVDPAHPTHIYLGADIGVWRSTDGGVTWTTFSEGLPDAAVIDLALHAPRRLLRAATYGRSVWERSLDAHPPEAQPQRDVQLYIRHTQLDRGRYPTVDGLPDPTGPGRSVVHYRGPDIKLDTPTVDGQYQFPPGTTLDFLDFVDTLTDEPRERATRATDPLSSRVYVQVHNRGVAAADSVQVMLLVAPASAALPALPPGYAASVGSGTPIRTDHWRTAGFAILQDVRPGAPQVAAFTLPPNLRPPPANPYGDQPPCVLALVRHPDDPFTSTETAPDLLGLGERKAAVKNLTVAQFAGAAPPATALVVPLRLHNSGLEQPLLSTLSVRIGGYRGRVRLALPRLDTDGDLGELIRNGQLVTDDGTFATWADQHVQMIETDLSGDRSYDPEWSTQRIDDVHQARTAGLVIESQDSDLLAVDRIILPPGGSAGVFLMVNRPVDGQSDGFTDMDVQQLDADGGQALIGGVTVRVQTMHTAIAPPTH